MDRTLERDRTLSGGRRVNQRRILQPDAEEEVELETDMVTSHTAELRLE